MSLIKAYTIVDRRTNQAFALQFRHRPALVAFREHAHAHLSARAVERREQVLGTMAETDSLFAADESLPEPAFHFIKGWESYDTLLEECHADELDLMFCTDVESRQGEALEFSGYVQSSE